MIDPVSEELERRAQLALPWKPAVLAALTLHIMAVAALLVAPREGRHRLSLPMVQVRLAQPPGPSAPARQEAAARPQTPAAAATPARAPAKPTAPPRHPLPEKKAPRTRPKPPIPAAPEAAGESQRPVQGAPPRGDSGQRSAGGGIALGASAAGDDQGFPYAYYLNRLLALIESNWFRPPDAAPSQCRVLCRVDRSGRLIEAGIEQPSETPAFDRAALRAVYASSPFPPLPQGYGGASLTLHLEFGP